MISFTTPYVTEEALLEELRRANLQTEKVNQALIQSKESHKNQERDGGTPYLEEHIYPIAHSIMQRYRNHPELETLIILALLHDTVEDDPNYDIEKCKSIFGEKIAKLLEVLTKNNVIGQNLSQEQKFEKNRLYMEKVKDADILAKIVKLEDRLNNVLSIKNIEKNPKYQRCIREIEEFFIPLAKEIDKFYVESFEEQIHRLKIHM